jgi:hypothetical protein
MPPVNLLAVGAAAVVCFVVAGLWYSPVMFFKAWAAEVGLTAEDAAKNRPLKLASAFVLVLVGALVFAFFLGPKVTPLQGTLYGFAAGLTWVAFSIGLNYLFEGKSLKLFLINGGYHTVEFTLIGLILGLWH